MQQRLRLGRRHSWLALCVAVVGGLLAAPSASAITSAQCDARANDTPSKLIECIQTADLGNHMKAFQKIANQNPGPDGHPSRNSGEPGYKASVDYVAARMRAAGYNVTIQPYKFLYYAYVGVPTFTEVSPTPHTYTLNGDWGPGQSTGTANAAIQPVGGIVMPPDPNGSTSTSGCTSADLPVSRRAESLSSNVVVAISV